MTTKKHQPRSLRLSGGTIDGDSERIAKEITRMLCSSGDTAEWNAAPSSDKVLRENVRAGRVKCVEHFVRLVRWCGNGPRIAATIRALFTPTPAADATDAALACFETRAQAALDPLEIRWATGEELSIPELFEMIDLCEEEKASADAIETRIEQEVFRRIGFDPAARPLTRAAS